MEEAKKMKCYKRLMYKQFSKSQVFVDHSFWVICRNVSRTFVELCMETPHWCTWSYGRRKSTKTSRVHFFYKSSLFSLTYVRINMSSNTWNCYTAESQEERLFFNETAFLFWCHALWKPGSSRNETCYENGNSCKDLFVVYLQSSVNTNS